ncbi:MAG TPA: hypothetical protein PLO64_07465 [Methanothermobacter sp.]|nr:hypothetical protein [Methanothermobacter sp.]
MLNRPRTKLQVHYSTIGRYYHQPINPPKENHKHEKKNSMITHLNKGKKITSYIENELQTPEDALLHPHKKSPL